MDQAGAADALARLTAVAEDLAVSEIGWAERTRSRFSRSGFFSTWSLNSSSLLRARLYGWRHDDEHRKGSLLRTSGRVACAIAHPSGSRVDLAAPKKIGALMCSRGHSMTRDMRSRADGTVVSETLTMRLNACAKVQPFTFLRSQ